MTTSRSSFRIDRFHVPEPALAAFMSRLHRIDRLLATMPGCRQHLVLEQSGGADDLRVVLTLVEWEDVQAMASARAAVQEEYAREGFDPPAFMRALGVQPEFGVYAAGARAEAVAAA
jgi:heme-degrading monooxygenase HmoA